MTSTHTPDDHGGSRRRRDLQRRARAKARAEGMNYTTALRQLMAQEQAAATGGHDTGASDTAASDTGAGGAGGESISDRVRAALARLQQQRSDEPDEPSPDSDWPEEEYDFPSTRQLIDRALDGALLEDLGLLHPGAPERAHRSDVYMDIDVPEQANDPEIIELHVDTATRDLQLVEEFEGGIEIVHLEAQADVAIRAFVREEDLPSLGAHQVLDPNADEGWAQVRFDRKVVVEFDATVDVGAETAELDYAGATQLRR